MKHLSQKRGCTSHHRNKRLSLSRLDQNKNIIDGLLGMLTGVELLRHRTRSTGPFAPQKLNHTAEKLLRKNAAAILDKLAAGECGRGSDVYSLDRHGTEHLTSNY